MVAMCIGSERWEELSPEFRMRIILLDRHTDEGMTTMQDQNTLRRVLARWLDFCDPADVAEFFDAMPEYEEQGPEDVEFA